MEARPLGRDPDYLKPAKFKDHLTLSELANEVGRATSWLRVLEKEDRIPKAARVKRGKLMVRMWSPAQVEEIKQIISTHRRGRPRNAKA